MCLAVPGTVIEINGDEAVVDLHGNRLRADISLTPEVAAGQWVLVHAGFAIAVVDEQDALETWEYLREYERGEWLDDAGGEPVDAAQAGGEA